MRRIAVLVLALSLSISCAAGPSDRPNFAVEQNNGGSQDSSTTTASPAPAVPEFLAPRKELNWADCTGSTFTTIGVESAPAGLLAECASFSVPLDPGGAARGSLELAAVRMKTSATTTNAAPLIMTTGSDIASSTQLAILAIRNQTTLLKEHPVIAIDRRGTGKSAPITCRTDADREEMFNQTQFDRGGKDPVDTLNKIARAATVSCTDKLRPAETVFDNKHAAQDLEQLRIAFDVPALGLLGIGNGSEVALAYAEQYPRHIARLILDSAPVPKADASTLAEHRIKGVEAALAKFSDICIAVNCALGQNPVQAINDLMNRAKTDQLRPISANALAKAITASLAFPQNEPTTEVKALADVLTSANRGDTVALQTLISRTAQKLATDGQFVNTCTDSQQRTTPERVQELATEWSAQYPIFGQVTAFELVNCLPWPIGTPGILPTDFTVPTLILGAMANPIYGGDGAAAAATVITSSGSTTATVTWQGIGYGVLTHSSCAATAANSYLNAGQLPATSTVCPA
ncbi:MAG: alpha/beta fold hydrolase [Mycobacteriaceae bacterium]